MVLAGDEQGYAPASLLEPIDESSAADDDTFNDRGLLSREMMSSVVVLQLFTKLYIIVIRMHQGVYEFYKPEGPRL